MFFKTIEMIWPFIREMVIGDKSLLDALKYNKKRVLLVILIFVSIGTNFFSIHRLITISQQYIVLNNKLLKITTLCVNQDGSSKISNKDSYMGITNDLAMLEHNENIIKCGKFIMPQLPNMPPLPLKEIDSLKSGDSLNLSIIEKNHIIELHKYTESLKKTILDSYTLYLNSCTGEKK